MAARLEGKVAVVTGAGGGLGRAIAVRYAEEGASVVCQDLVAESAATTVSAVESAGGRALAWACDVTDGAAIEAMFDAAASALGLVDVLVSNAGVDRTPGDGFDQPVQVAAMSDDAWHRMMAIHLDGAFFTTRAMVRRLVDAGRGGSIVYMASIAGLAGWGPVHYATAKAGLLGLTRSMARFYGGIGVRANAICPGVIDTPMTAAVPSEMIDGLKMLTPLQRVGQPADIAELAVYLAGDESGFVTGQAISPNGGLVI